MKKILIVLVLISSGVTLYANRSGRGANDGGEHVAKSEALAEHSDTASIFRGLTEYKFII